MTETLHQLLQAHFGLKTTFHENPLVSQVQTTATKVIAANPNRLGLVITNAGGNTVYLSTKNTVAVGAGMVLVPNGGAVSFKWDIDFGLVTSEFWGIASGAASNVNVIEITTV